MTSPRRIAPLAAVLLLLPAAALAQAVSTSTASFQQGTGGYSGASDRLINMTGGTSTRSTAAVDGSSSGDLTESQYFLTFDSIFGGAAGQIPAGATILDASLRVTTGGGANDGSSGYFLMSGMRVPYASGTSLLQFGSGTAAPGLNGPTYANGNATIGYGSLRAPAVNTAYTIPLGPGLVQQWADGTLANNGFVAQAQTTDAWVLAGVANTTVASRPQLAVTYTTQPTTTASLKQGVAGYAGLTAVTMNGVTGATLDATAASSIAVDGPTGGTPPGDTGSPDLLGFLKFDGVVGSAADQVPVRASVAKSWLVLTTGNSSNDQSAGPFTVHQMLTPWTTASTYAGFGSTGPVSGVNFVAAATGTANAVAQNSQAWIDVSAAVAAWKNGAANHGLLVKAGTTDGWTFGGGGNSDAGRRPDLRTAYVIDPLVWTGATSSAWDRGSAVGTGGTQNWQLQTAGTATNFIDTDRVVFNANAAGEGNVVVTIAEVVSPQRTTIDVADRGYTFTGSGRITGAGLLVKTGTGVAVLATDNDFTGGTTVSAGTLQVGGGGGTGSLAGGIAVASGATLAFDRTGSVSMAGAVTGSGSIVKAGSGRVALSAPIAFAGPVSVTAGTLVLGSGSTGVGGVTVADGATVAASSGATATTFTTPTLALGSAGSTLAFELAASSNPSVPLLSVTQADGLTLGGGSHTIALASTGALGVGRFTLVDYAGTGIATGFTLATLPQRLTGSLVYDTTATTIDLDITAVDTLRWQGGSSTTWDTGSAVDVGGAFNWVLASTGTTVTNFFTGDQIGFDDSAAGGTVSVTGVVSPGAIVASNATLDYTLGGPGSIGGSGAFAKTAAGRLTLLVSNSSSGGTTVSAGTLQLGDASTAVAVQGDVTVTGGVLDVRQARLAGTLGVSAGSAAFTSGTVAGLVTVSGGTASFGAGTFESGAAVTAGRLAVGDGGLTGNVSIADGATLAFGHAADVTYTSVLSGSGAIAKTGAGRLTLTANNNPFTGTLTIDGGEVRIDDQGAGGDFGATSIVVNDGGTFQFGNATVGNPDLPGYTFITVNTGGLVVWQEGEDFGGVNLQGGTIDMQQGGINATGTTAQQAWTSGTVTGATFAIAGTNPIVKTTAGEVLVTGSSSITTTGGIAVREGTLRFASILNLGSGSVALGAVGSSGTYRYDGATASRSGAFVLDGVGGIAVTDAASVLTLPTGLTGTGGLVKSGSGSLLLSGSGSYTGGTTIVGGTLTAGVPRALGVGNVVVGNGGVLSVASTLDLGAGFGVSTQPGGVVSVASGGSLPLAAGSSLAGFQSASVATTAAILSGSVAAGGGTVSMTWQPTQAGLFADVLELSTATGTTPFVLSMTYSSGLDAGTASGLALGWNSASGTAAAVWVNATTGNTVTTASPAQRGYLGSFTDFQTQYGGDLTAYVGAYGRDPATSSTWAVVDHNSQFSIVPEPRTTTFLAIAAVAAWAGRRLRRAAAAAALAALLAGGAAEAQTTVTFQQGALLGDGVTTYSGISEAAIGNATATSTVTTVGIDGVSSGDGTERQFFLKYDSIFGSAAGLIPTGATILDAQLTLRTTGNSNSQSGGTFVIGGMQVPFSAATTLNDLGTGNGAITTNGPTYANGLATLPLAGYRAPAQNFFYSAFVAPLVQQWADGTLVNNGMVVQAHTTDAWQVFGSADATVAYRPKLSVTYTTAPTVTTSIKPGVAGYAGFSGVTLHGLTNATLDVTAGTAITLDGPTANTPPGDAGSPDLLGIVKYDGIFGAGSAQVPARANVVKAWFVPTTGNASNDESGGPYLAYRMLTAWGSSTTYSMYGTGSSGPVAGVDYVAATSGSAVALGKNAQGWFDITSAVNDWQAGADNNGLLIRAATTDGWSFGGPAASDANRRPDLRVTYTLDSLVWTGSGSAVWDRGTAVGTGGTQNWLLQTAGSATNFIDTDRVVFDDSAAGAGPLAVTIAEAVAPQRVTLDAGSRSQTFAGVGRITGAGSLVKAGAGTATLATDNDYTGGTTVAAGTLRIGAGGTAGGIAGPIAVDSAAVLEFNRAGRLTVAGSLSGSGSLVNAGPGRVDLLGTHSFTGPITVSSGTLGLSPFAAASVTVANGASFAVVNSGSESTFTVPTLTLGSLASDLRFDLASSGNPVVPLLSVTNADGLVRSGGAHTISVQTAGALQAGRFTLLNYDGAAISSGFTLASLPARLAGGLVYDTVNTAIDLEITGLDSVRWVGDVSAAWDAGTAVDVGGTRNWELSSSSLTTNFVAGDQVVFDDSAVTGSVSLSAAVAPGSILVDNAAVAYTFGGPGAIAGGGSLVKQGAGRLALLVSNSSTGVMTVAGGTLEAGDGSTAVTIAAPLTVSGSGGFTLRNGSLTGGLTVASGSATIAGGSLAAAATVDGGVLSIAAAGPAPSLAAGLVVNAAGTLRFDQTDGLVFGEAISGSGAVVQSGSGRTTFTASNNAFTGSVTIDAGEVRIEDNGAGGDFGASAIVVNNGGTFQFGSNQVGNPDLPTTTFITANAGGRVIWQEGEDLGGVHLLGGEIDLQQGGITSSGTPAVQTWTRGRLTGSGTQAFTFGGAAAIVKSTTGLVTVDGSASITSTGGATIEDGTLRLAAAANLGTAPLTLGGAATAGTLLYDGVSATRSGAITLAAGGGTVEVTSPAAVLSLTGSVTGSGPLVKAGPGTVVFAGANALQGSFTVAGGTLGSTPFNAVAGGVVSPGAGFAVVNTAATTTLTLPTLSLGAGSTLAFSLAEAGIPSVPLLSVTTADGLTLSGSVGVSVASSQALGVGRFTLVEYDGAPLPASFTLASLPPRVLATLVNDTANTRLDLDVVGTGQLTWRGNASPTWNTGSAVDVGGAFNWLDTSTSQATNFVVGDRVRFDDTATGTAVAVDEIVTPAEITFDNAAREFTLSGSGGITSGGITKTGTGRVTLAVAKTGTQGTTISAGTLRIGDSLVSGSFAGPVSVASGAVFDVANGVASGRATVAGGLVTVTGSLVGGAAVDAGELRIGDGGTAGGLAGNVAIAAGATTTFNRGDALAYSGTLSGAGSIVKTGSGQLALLAASTGFTGSVTVDEGELLLEDRGQGGDLNAVSIVVNDGGRFTFGAAGNPDFPQSTDVTVNAGGRFDLQQGENWGGLILDGGLVTFSGTRTGVNMNLDRIALRSGTIRSDLGAGGTGGQITRLAAGQFIQKTTAGTVSFGPGTSIQPDAPVNLEDGVLEFDVTALPATGNGAFTIGDAGNATRLRMAGVGTGTFGRYAYVGNPSLTIDVVDAAATMAVTGTMEGTGAVTKTGLGILDLLRATGLTAATTVAQGTLRASDAGALSLSEVTVQAGATLDVAGGVTMRSPKVTVAGGVLRAGVLAVDSSAGVTRVEVHGAGTIAGSPALSVGSGGSLVLSASASASVPLASLVVDESAGLLDLGVGGLVIAPGGLTEAALMADLVAGRGGDGSWNGTHGITSSVAAASGLSRSVGWAVDSSDGSIRVAFAAPGDANVDGQFDILDVAAFFEASKYDAGVAAIWSEGDFNYDGLFDINDAGDLLGTGLYDAGSYLPTLASAAMPVAAVPEPTAIGLLGAAAAAIAACRVRLPRGGCRNPRGGAR